MPSGLDLLDDPRDEEASREPAVPGVGEREPHLVEGVLVHSRHHAQLELSLGALLGGALEVGLRLVQRDHVRRSLRLEEGGHARVRLRAVGEEIDETRRVHVALLAMLAAAGGAARCAVVEVVDERLEERVLVRLDARHGALDEARHVELGGRRVLTHVRHLDVAELGEPRPTRRVRRVVVGDERARRARRRDGLRAVKRQDDEGGTSEEGTAAHRCRGGSSLGAKAELRVWRIVRPYGLQRRH